MGPARMRFKLSSKSAQPGAAVPHAPGRKETNSIAGDLSVWQKRRTASQACSKDSTPAVCGVVDIAGHFSALESTAEGGCTDTNKKSCFFSKISQAPLCAICVLCG